MSARRAAYAVGGAAVAALTAVGLTLSPATAGASGDTLSTAYAIGASGLLDVAKTPYLDSSNGFQEKSLANLDVPENLLSTGVLNSSVDEGSASSSVADLKVSLAQILDNDMLGLTASLIKATCEEGEGSAALADAKIAGKDLDVSPPPNTGVEVPGLGGVVLNKQEKNEDGSLSVTALHIDLGGQQTIDIANASCGMSEDDAPKPPGDGDDGGDDGGKAPRPTPVAGHHPVTG
ncbi:MAG: hypothetical protein GEU98_01765 [Pseudonocardiaceae bacterium]|nr:hypothetical protein [Pseudonocardiaceae bacterium]